MASTRASNALAERLLNALHDIYMPTGVVKVLRSPNRLVDGLIPADIIEDGDTDRLLTLVRWAEMTADGNF